MCAGVGRSCRPGSEVGQVGASATHAPSRGVLCALQAGSTPLVRDVAQHGLDIEVVQVGAHRELLTGVSDVLVEFLGGVGAHQHRHPAPLIGLPQALLGRRSRSTRAATPDGEQRHRWAIIHLDSWEAELAMRLGEDGVTQQRTLLDRAWGQRPGAAEFHPT